MAATEPKDSHALFSRFTEERNLEDLLELYDAEAVYVPAKGQRLSGHAQIRPMLEAMLAPGNPLPRLELVDLIVRGDVALERTRWILDFEGADGEPGQASGDSTAVLGKQDDGCWRILIDDPGLG